jgi:DNA-binding transcriptional ArsR family regulator
MRPNASSLLNKLVHLRKETTRVREWPRVRRAARLPPIRPLRPPVKPITDIDDPRYLKALAHPLRIRILAMLAERSASPVQLSGKLDASLGTVAYHVRTLHTLGLVELVDTRQRRGATEHYYRAQPYPRFSDDAWGALAPVDKQRMLSAMLQQIGQFVSASAASGGFDRADSHLTRNSLRLDARGWEQLAEASKGWLREADEIEAAAAARMKRSAAADGDGDGDGHAPALDVGLVMMLFEALPFSEHPPEATDRDGRTGRRRRPRSAND